MGVLHNTRFPVIQYLRWLQTNKNYKHNWNFRYGSYSYRMSIIRMLHKRDDGEIWIPNLSLWLIPSRWVLCFITQLRRFFFSVWKFIGTMYLKANIVSNQESLTKSYIICTLKKQPKKLPMHNHNDICTNSLWFRCARTLWYHEFKASLRSM